MYFTESYEEVESKRAVRDQALPGLPYISYKGAEAVKMASSFKLLLRDNVGEALYRDGRRSEKAYVDMANKTLRDVVSKGYLDVVSLGHDYGNLYILGDVGYEYLGLDKPEDTALSRQDIVRYYSINRVFTVLCKQYRSNYRVGWETGGMFGDALCVIKDGNEILKTYVIVYIKPRLRDAAIDATLEAQRMWAGKDLGEFGKADVIAVKVDSENFMLEIDEDTTEQEIADWVD